MIKFVNYLSTPIGIIFTSYVLIIAAFLNFLSFHQYSIFTYEVAIILFGWAIVCTICGYIYAGCRHFLRLLMICLLVLFTSELLHYGIGGAGITLLLIVLIREKILIVTGIVAVSILVTVPMQYLQPPVSKNKSIQFNGNNDLPVIIHIVLDEYMGLEGMAKMKSTKSFINTMRADFIKHDVVLFEKAYSKHLHTVESMPTILNFDAKSYMSDIQENTGILLRNKYFDYLDKMGYKINVTQMNILDYCKHKSVIACRTVQEANPTSLDFYQIPAINKAQLISLSFLRLSSTAQKISKGFSLITHWLVKSEIKIPKLAFGLRNLGGPILSTLTGKVEFDRLIEEVNNMQLGEVYFVHIPFPHYPYIFTANCKIKPLDEWQFGYSRGINPVLKEAGYIDQIQCTHQKIKALISALDQSQIKDNHILILHGDHGSRNARIVPTAFSLGKFSNEDLIKGFSTFFAIRSRGGISVKSNNRVSIDTLLKALVRNNFDTAKIHLPDRDPQVFLYAGKGVPGTSYPYKAEGQ